MKFTDLFIRRPVFAVVVSLLLMVGGLEFGPERLPPPTAQRHHAAVRPKDADAALRNLIRKGFAAHSLNLAAVPTSCGPRVTSPYQAV